MHAHAQHDHHCPHIYTTYVREQFAPFVQSHLDAVWQADQFARISHVLSGENYLQPPEFPMRGPRTWSTKHILSWLCEQTKQDQSFGTTTLQNRPIKKVIKGPSCSAKATNTSSSDALVSRQQLMSYKDVLYQLYAVMDNLHIHWKLKQVISKRFSMFLLHKKLLKPYVAGNAEKSRAQRFYYWNRMPDTPPKARIPKVRIYPSTVCNLDEVAKSQMLDLIKYQRALILQLQQEKISKTATTDLCPKMTIPSFESERSSDERKRESLEVIFQRKENPSTSKHYPSSQNVAKNLELFFDVCISSMEIAGEMSTATKTEIRVPHATFQTTSEGPSSSSHAFTNSNRGLLFQIKKSLYSWQGSLISSLFGQKTFQCKDAPENQKYSPSLSERQNCKANDSRNLVSIVESTGHLELGNSNADVNEELRLELITDLLDRVHLNIEKEKNGMKENSTLDENSQNSTATLELLKKICEESPEEKKRRNEVAELVDQENTVAVETKLD